jgi:hypothetical protein
LPLRAGEEVFIPEPAAALIHRRPG